MKLLQITALALCLNMPIAHANEEDARFCHQMFKVANYGGFGTCAAMGLGAILIGMRRISSAISTPDAIPLIPLNQSPNTSPTVTRISEGLKLIGMGTIITTGSFVSMVAMQAIGNTCDNNDSSSQ